MRKIAFILFTCILLIAGCSKDAVEGAKATGKYKGEFAYPIITIELLKGSCAALTIETQFGITQTTTDVKTNGKYPNLSYAGTFKSPSVMVQDGGFLIDVVFSSPEEFFAKGNFFVSGEGKDGNPMAESGEINTTFRRIE